MGLSAGKLSRSEELECLKQAMSGETNLTCALPLRVIVLIAAGLAW